MTELKVKLQKGFMKQIIAVIMAACLGVTMLPVSALAEDAGDGEEQIVQVTSLKISPESAEEIKVGDEVQLQAVMAITDVSPASADKEEGSDGAESRAEQEEGSDEAEADSVTAISPVVPEWSSSDEEIASVMTAEDPTVATVTAKAAGTVTITVQVGALKDTLELTVKEAVDPTPQTPEVADVQIKPKKVEFTKENETQQLRAEVTMTPEGPEAEDGLEFKWESADKAIAEVDGTGKTATVTAKKTGNTTVKVTVKDKEGNTKEATAEVSVAIDEEEPTTPEEPEVAEVTVMPDALELNKDAQTGTLKAEAKLSPESPEAEVTYTWETSDAEVATVEESGEEVTVTAKKTGTATITVTAKTKNGKVEKNATAEVTVTLEDGENPDVTPEEPEVAEVTVTPDALTLKEIGAEGELTAEVSITPETPESPEAEVTYTWTSSDDGIVSVEGNGNQATVTAKAKGEAEITVSAKIGDGEAKEAKAVVKVEGTDDGNGPDDGKKPVTSIALDKKELTYDTIGTEQTLTATVGPDDATDKTVTWSSSDEKVATVKDGKVTSVGNGTATITAKAGDQTATAKVTVSQKTESVSIELNKQIVKGTLPAQIKKSYALKAIVTPDNADAAKAVVTWSSSNTKVATVAANGKVKIKKAGTVTITAKTADGSEASVKFKATKKAVRVKKLAVVGAKTMKAKSSQTLLAKITPATAGNQKVTWKTSNKKIATVNGKGVVKAKKKGTVTITAVSKDGGKKKTFKIKVK